MGVCPKCGKEIAKDSKFCEYCGTRLGNVSNKPLWMTFFITILFFVILNVGAWFYFADTAGTMTQLVPQPIVRVDGGENAEVSDLQGRLDSLILQNKTLKESNELLHSQNASLQSQNASLQSQNASLKSENSTLAARVQRYKELFAN